MARASRIYVEGRHDAELVEKIWGDDLRDVGVVVEYLEGVDHLPQIMAEFQPGPGRRLGVLVDHLVPGSKESRIAAGLARDGVLIVGHPFIDIWQAVKPSVIGIGRWPEVPRGIPWKDGVLRAIGWDDNPDRRPGGGSSAPSAPSPIWSRNCSAGWRSSSTSSPTPERADRARRPGARAGRGPPAAGPARR